LETALAKQIIEMLPSIEMVRMVNSGTEATMSAIRVARGYTGREKIVKFEGGWHGHGDSFLIKAGSSALTLGAPDSPGIPLGTAAATITVDFNDGDAVAQTIAQNPGEIAAVIVEPVAGNMGTIPPRPGFLQQLRQITEENGIVLIFDEVITGFRVGLGGAQEHYNVLPDMTCLGKIVGGGLPVGAYGGKKEIMQEVAPLGKKISQAGTLSGNPLAMCAGLMQLQMLSEPGVYQRLDEIATRLAAGMRQNIEQLQLNWTINQVGGMLSMFFTEQEVVDFTSASSSDTERFRRYFWEMIEQGVYLAPSQFECMFPSAVHSEDDIDKTLQAHYKALKAIH
jgi:glutamate-1-semialdehyde 2,1-aminomutase